MLKLSKYLSQYKWSCIFGAFFKFLEVIFELLLPSIMALIINNGVAKGDTEYIIQMGAVMILMACIGYGCALICQYYASRASQGFGTSLRNKLYEHILSFSFTQLDRFGTSTLTTRLTNDVNQLQLWVAMMIRLTTRAPFICIGSIVMTFFLDWQLALVLLCATPILALIVFFITKKTAPLYKKYQKKLDQLSSILRENLSGVRVIRAFSTLPKESKQFEESNESLRDTGLSIGRMSSFFNPLTSLTINLVVIVVLWISGLRIEIGGLSQGQVIAFINYVNQILISILVLSNLIILLTKALASAERVNEVLDVEGENNKHNNVEQEEKHVDAMIEFDDVSFGYHASGEMALEYITASIQSNEIIGIIGGTGSGKSTLMNLIPRFYEVGQGNLYVDGYDVKDYDMSSLREKIAMVPQETTLFSGTIKDNICWGNEEASLDDMKDAASMAQAMEFIDGLDKGFDSIVQRNGKNFSGGQKQRLSIARALIAKPKILILDDATSALDFLTEANFRKALRESDWIHTVCIVSQRIGAVQHADRIMVMDDGKIVGFDTHDNLMKTCEAYIHIYESQVEVA